MTKEQKIQMANGLIALRDQLPLLIEKEIEEIKNGHDGADYCICHSTNRIHAMYCQGIFCAGDGCPLHRNDDNFLGGIENAMRWAESVIGFIDDPQKEIATLDSKAKWRLA